MRIADIVGALVDRPEAVLVGTDAAAEVAERVAGVLGVPAGPSRPSGGAPVVVLATAEEDLAAVVEEALGRAGGLRPTDTFLLLLPDGRGALPVEAATAAAATHDLELVAVEDLAHPTLGTALRLVTAEDPAVAAARTELRLERAVSRRARTAAVAAARELERRGERIDALTAEVSELRERLETVEVTHERTISTQDRELTTLRREVGQLEASTSYRVGHTLVRLLKEPRLWLRIPARVLRWLRS